MWLAILLSSKSVSPLHKMIHSVNEALLCTYARSQYLVGNIAKQIENTNITLPDVRVLGGCAVPGSPTT